MAQPFAGCGAVTFKKSDSPAVAMMICAATALRESGEAQCQAGWQMAVHSE